MNAIFIASGYVLIIAYAVNLEIYDTHPLAECMSYLRPDHDPNLPVSRPERLKRLSGLLLIDLKYNMESLPCSKLLSD